MFLRHVSGQLAPYLDDRLGERKAREVELHLKQCEECTAECEQVRFAMAMVQYLPRAEAPDAIWRSIETQLQENQPATHPGWRFALAAMALAVVAVGVYWGMDRRAGSRWQVTDVSGSARAGAIGAGQWIETDSHSRARIRMGEIGSVEIEPGTRLRVVATGARENRIVLQRGEIQAWVSAPPRLFFVDTAAGTAVDLGCEYSLDTDEDGSGVLRVTKGWVAFQWNGLESLVPAGASCRTQPHLGPGIPYFDDATDSFKQAAGAFGNTKNASEPLGIMLAEARVRDTLTLWHLLSRVDPEDRATVFDRIVALTPLPAGVSRELALKLDPETLKHWKDELAWTW